MPGADGSEVASTGRRRVDARSALAVALAVFGFPVLQWIIEIALAGLAVEGTANRVTADVVTAVVIGVCLYLLNRQRLALLKEKQRLLDELRGISEHYRQLAENASDIVYTAGRDRLTTWVSPAVTRILGWTPDEVLGRSMASFMLPDDQESTEEVRRRIYSGHPYDTPEGGFVMRFVTKGGDYRWLAIRVRQVADDRGQHVGVVGGLTLVDDLVQARKQAEVQESMLRLVSDAMLDPQVLMRVLRDDEGRPVDFRLEQVNRATCEYLRQTADQLVGKRLLEVAPQMEGGALFGQYLLAADSDGFFSVDAFASPAYMAGAVGYFDVRARHIVGDRLALAWRNVTAAREMAQRLADSERHFRLLAENSSDVILLSDADTTLHWVSPSAATTLGWPPEQLMGHRAVEFIHPDDLPALLEAVARSTATGETIRPRYRWRTPEGTYRWMEAAGRPVEDDGTGRVGRVVVLRNIDAEVAAQERLERRATYDDLTGAAMREVAFPRLAAASERVDEPGAGAAVLFIDVDDFKEVNDALGHAAGDAVLRALVHRMRANTRAMDTVARMGGDEFLVILEGVGELERAESIAHKIAAACSLPVPTADGEAIVTSSIGVTLVAPGEAPDDTVARADRAMYDAKRSGRNQVLATPAP